MSPQPSRDRSLRDIVVVLRRYALLVIAITAVGVIAAGVFSTSVARVYSAESSVVIAADPHVDPAAGPDQKNGSRLGTWIWVLADPAVFEQAAHRLAGNYSADDLATVGVDVRPIENSMVAAVTVRARDPKLAHDFSEALLQEARSTELARAIPITALKAVTVSEWPNLRRSLVLGGAAGFLCGIALAFLVADFTRDGEAQRKSDRRE